MASLLESQLKKQVAAAFNGQLLTGTLRKESGATLDQYGDLATITKTDYSFDGIRDSFSAFYAANAGIPVTDARILVIAGSLSSGIVPDQDDKVKIGGDWYRIVQVLEVDPAGATYTLQGHKIEAADA